MADYSRIESLTAETHKAVAAGILSYAERVGWKLCQVFSAEFPGATHITDYTPEMARVQFDALSAILEIHIMRGDGFDIGLRASQFLRDYRRQKYLMKDWTDEDWAPIDSIVKRCVKATNDFFEQDVHRRESPKVKRDAQCKCLLCGKQPAIKTGSHMIPHFLVARTFSYDGSTDREKVVVEAASLSKGKTERYFGHEVYDDTVSELLGRSFTDEEIEAEIEKPNALTRDYFFCKDCEDRFGTIESYYSEILDGRLKGYHSHIPYLFWLSVAWRMSIGGMGFKMTPEHEEKLRKVLNNCLSLKREEIETKKSKMGYCAYSLYRADDTRDERLGVFAPHTPTKPYMALIGTLFINFYTSSNAAVSFCRNHGMPSEELNFGTAPEKIGSLNFIEFWQVKRQILDMVWEDERNIWNLGQERNQTLCRVEPDPDFVKEQNPSCFRPEDEGMPIWMNTDNTAVTMAPHAVHVIDNWVKKHPGASVEDISAGTGYSLEELATILGYWEDRLKSIERKKKENTRKAQAFGKFMSLFD